MTDSFQTCATSAPRGYCKKCGTPLVEKGTSEAYFNGRFDPKTGRPKRPTQMRNWECPNQDKMAPWTHTIHTDYGDIDSEPSILQKLLRWL